MNQTSLAPEPTDLHESAGHLLRRVHQNMLLAFSQVMHDHDVTNVQFATLKAIATLEPATQREIAAFIAMEPSNMHSVLRRLQERGLVLVRQSRSDRRRHEIRLSKAGRALFSAIEPLEAEVGPRFLAALSDNERVQFVRLLKKLAFSPVGGGRAGP